MELKFELDPRQKDQLVDEIVTGILEKLVLPDLALIDQKLTKSEAAKLLRITEPTLDDYRRKGFIQFQKIGNRVYFRSSDIINAGVNIKRISLK